MTNHPTPHEIALHALARLPATTCVDVGDHHTQEHLLDALATIARRATLAHPTSEHVRAATQNAPIPTPGAIAERTSRRCHTSTNNDENPPSLECHADVDSCAALASKLFAYAATITHSPDAMPSSLMVATDAEFLGQALHAFTENMRALRADLLRPTSTESDDDVRRHRHATATGKARYLLRLATERLRHGCPEPELPHINASRPHPGQEAGTR
ncbi:hypothetical protein [Dermatophilus congolensis]|uniref:hypothetical protein n=2 Tax=Dermatophilus congolensis TaxID=1863 RepID=UPI001AAEA7AC|nr:hypothetical protein [Dermatophilus congolensis]MBO3142490.1 hypothetical protein [Dermatophilus congolensis]MBO3151479.1 hypothetical protein [Dermatophilus congolensis]MBO3176319.1 hypothetical protein [Dermatophilus congolensis]